MAIKKIVIIGGGTAGWFAAAKLKQDHKHLNVILVESPKIPIIGVGESVTPHVPFFFKSLGIDENDLMRQTGAIYKFANKFINWTGPNEYQYFGFNYPTCVNLIKHEHAYAGTELDWIFNDKTVRTTDTLMQLLQQQKLSNFDQYYYSAFHFMQQNTSPFLDTDYLLNTAHSYAYHINAELCAQYVRDKVALPLGVGHIKSTLTEVGIDNQQCITHITLENHHKITADLYIDATGLNAVLLNRLGWKSKNFKLNFIDRAWVCQSDYTDPVTEMTNYTQTIAEPYGWRFIVGLYHRKGNGYCFSSNHISDQSALDYFDQKVSLKKANPKLLTWTPKRFEQLAKGNAVAVGLSCGFTEPLEANGLYTIVTSILMLSQVISQSNNNDRLDFTHYNQILTQTIDDIANFIAVHYTLSPRSDSKFWQEMREIGRNECHSDLVYSKYYDKFNTINSAMQGYTLFPEYMWAQLAHSWKLDLDLWMKQELPTLDTEMTKLHFEYQENKNRLLSQHSENFYHWLKKHIFQDQSPSSFVTEKLSMN